MDLTTSTTDTQAILDNIAIAEAQKEYKNELEKFHIHNMLFAVIKEFNVDKIVGITKESKENIKRAIDYLHMMDYVKMENSGLSVLGICQKPPDLSYADKKALKSALVRDLPLFYQPIFKFLERADKSVFQSDKLEDQIIALEEKRKDVSKKLVEANLKYCGTLMEISDLKFGRHQRDVAEEILLKSKLNQTKASLLRALATEFVYNQTLHAPKAIKEAEQFLDIQLESE